VRSVSALLPFVLVLLAFWLLIIRPSRSRARQQQRLQNELVPGLEVMTTSGLLATVSAVEDDVVVLEVSPGVTMRWRKAAVAGITPAAGDLDVDTDADVDAEPSREPSSGASPKRPE
jgi:preprotein translocase subunit YajC